MRNTLISAILIEPFMAHPSFVDYARQLGLNKSVIWIVKPCRIPMSKNEKEKRIISMVSLDLQISLEFSDEVVTYPFFYALFRVSSFDITC